MSECTVSRPEEIKAVKESISHWSDVCMGCEDVVDETNCALCTLTGMRCGACPLKVSGNGCFGGDSSYRRYIDARRSQRYRGDFSFFCGTDTAPEAEAMLEALVNLLPPEHRKEYGG